MATIIEAGALWTTTEEIADYMVSQNLLFKCDSEHSKILEVDNPVYHISINAPDGFGIMSIQGAIIDAEKSMEKNFLYYNLIYYILVFCFFVLCWSYFQLFYYSE